MTETQLEPAAGATTIHLTLDSRYVPTWGMKEGLRELIQNWLDAGGHGQPTLKDGCLTLENPDATMNREVLLIGHSTKPGTDARGQFGEGLKLGTLALLRDGCQVIVHVPGEKWVARLDAHPALGRQVLAWDIKEHPNIGGVRVEVHGITGDDLASMRRVFIWGCDHTQSSLLQGEDRRGAVYVKGIHVMDQPGLAFGYNIHDLKTDRDRKLVDNYELGAATNRVMLNALGLGEVSGVAVLQAYLDNKFEAMGGGDRPQLNALGRQVLTEAWQKILGDTIPCGPYDIKEADKLRKLGKRARCVRRQLLNLLDLPNGEDVLKDLRDGRVAHTLAIQEKRNLEWALAHLAVGVSVVPRIEVSQFMDSSVGLTAEDGVVHLNAKMLSSKTRALCQLAIGLDADMAAILDHLLETNGVVRA